MRLNRNSYIPTDAVSIDCGETDAQVFTYANNGNLCAVAFHGRAQKPDWKYRFANSVDRQDHIDRFVEKRRDYKQRRDEERQRRNQGHGLKVGDIIYCSWGYDQTNVDFYEVSKLVGKCTIEVKEVAALKTETNICQEQLCLKKVFLLVKPSEKE